MTTVTEKTAKAINSLTSDEDERQELWAHYLEKGDDDLTALSIFLDKFRKQYSEDELLQITVWKQANTLDHQILLNFFENFSELEQTVMRLLILDVPLDGIASIMNFDVVQLRHIISIIRLNEAWTNFHGT